MQCDERLSAAKEDEDDGEAWHEANRARTCCTAEIPDLNDFPYVVSKSAVIIIP
jgi:hypothetical protein